MRRDEDMICAGAPVPEWELRRDDLYGGSDQRSGVSDGGESIDSAEVAGDVDGDEEEVSLPWIQRPESLALH